MLDRIVGLTGDPPNKLGAIIEATNEVRRVRLGGSDVPRFIFRSPLGQLVLELLSRRSPISGSNGRLAYLITARFHLEEMGLVAPAMSVTYGGNAEGGYFNGTSHKIWLFQVAPDSRRMTAGLDLNLRDATASIYGDAIERQPASLTGEGALRLPYERDPSTYLELMGVEGLNDPVAPLLGFRLQAISPYNHREVWPMSIPKHLSVQT